MIYSITIYLKDGEKETIGNFDLNKVKEIKSKLDLNNEVYQVNKVDDCGNLTEVNI